jgi:hypothetical protein
MPKAIDFLMINLYLCCMSFYNSYTKSFKLPMSSRNRPFKFPVSILIGSTPSNILQVTKGYRIDIRYYPKFLLSFLVSLIFEVLNLAERIFEKGMLKNVVAEEPPIFVIGFWRSGTTLLHSMLCQDKRAGYVTTFHGVFPNLVLTQKKWLKEFTNTILPKNRPFDGYSMDMDFPQEEDFAMMSLQPRSIYKMFYFPKDYNEIYKKELNFEVLPETEPLEKEISVSCSQGNEKYRRCAIHFQKPMQYIQDQIPHGTIPRCTFHLYIQKSLFSGRIVVPVCQ